MNELFYDWNLKGRKGGELMNEILDNLFHHTSSREKVKRHLQNF
jgi:hypothetical protein